ncbi:TOBE domain-containing protein, partial [Burkholderia sp. SIMBA_024]|uniref:TOBE domain-containing protein n=1 Tax=Burkholderia sp. SIMBA_024 TaxID=3085768 RepID=UPI00397A7A8D
VIRLVTPTDTGLDATVVNVIYFGPLWRITIELKDGQVLVCSVPGTRQPFAMGDRVNVSWDAADAVPLASAHSD